MNVMQKLNNLEKTISQFNDLEIMNDDNAKHFIQNLQELFDNFQTTEYFETYAKKWITLFFETKIKFSSAALWAETLQKMYITTLQNLELKSDDIKFSLEFILIWMESGELTNIKNFNKYLDKFITILLALYEQAFSSMVFHYQRLFFKIVYDLVHILGQDYAKPLLLRKMFDVKLSKQIVRIQKPQFETEIRSLINGINKKSDVFKTFAIVAKSIKIGDVIIEKPKLFSDLWIDFNISFMEISFYFDDNKGFDAINIPIKSIIDILTVNNVDIELNIALSSNLLHLESGAQYTIKGTNAISVTFPNGNDTNMLKNLIIPEYLKWVNQNLENAVSGESCHKDLLETFANDTDTSESLLESNHSTVVINDSQDVVELGPITNGLYESFKQTMGDSGSQTKNIVVQRVYPLPKIGISKANIETITFQNAPISTSIIPESQPIVVQRHCYREVYSEVTQHIQGQMASSNIQHKSTKKNETYLPLSNENHVDLLVVEYQSIIEDDPARAKVDRLNNWVNMTLQNMNKGCNMYDGLNGSSNDISDVDPEVDKAEYKLSQAPPRKDQKRYLLRSHKTNPNWVLKKYEDSLDTEYRKKLCKLVEGMLNKLNNPRKDFLENKVKRLKLEQRKKLIESFEQVSATINAIQVTGDKIKELQEKVTIRMDHQSRRIERYKATVAAHNAEINDLNAKSSAISAQFNANLIETAEPTEKQIWNNYVLNITRYIQNNLLNNLY